MDKFKSFNPPVRVEVSTSYSHYVAPDKEYCTDIGKKPGDELLVVASYFKEELPFVVVYDGNNDEFYSLFAYFVKEAPSFFDESLELPLAQ